MSEIVWAEEFTTPEGEPWFELTVAYPDGLQKWAAVPTEPITERPYAGQIRWLRPIS